MTTYPIRRPIWSEIYEDVAHTPDRDNFLYSITRETLKIAASAIKRSQEEEAYHHTAAALAEIEYALNVAEPDFPPSVEKEKRNPGDDDPGSYSEDDNKEMKTLVCADCYLPYSSDKWCDCVVSHEIWKKIAPEVPGIVLCFNCMAGRLIKMDMINVPVTIRSGPFLLAWDESARVNQLGKAMQNLLDLCQQGNFSNGVEEYGIDEGEVKAGEIIEEAEKILKDLT